MSESSHSRIRERKNLNYAVVTTEASVDSMGKLGFG